MLMLCHHCIFQSTHPSWGATLRFRFRFCLSPYFNPRTHRGVRRDWVFTYPRELCISIHAPIVGCDIMTKYLCKYTKRFQSTHPSWGATVHMDETTPHIDVFQSTHPSWGATSITHPHARHILIFQSTHPSWGATICILD